MYIRNVEMNGRKGKERKTKNLNCTLKDLGGDHVEKSKLSKYVSKPKQCIYSTEALRQETKISEGGKRKKKREGEGT